MRRMIGGVPEIRRQSGLVLLAEWTPSSAMLNETLTVNGDVDKFLEVEAQYINNTASDNSLRCRLNADSGSNYAYARVSVVDGASGALENLSLAAMELFVCLASRSASGSALLHLQSGKVRMSEIHISFQAGAQDIFGFHYHSLWSNTADNITSITFTTTGNCTGVIRVWKRV